MTTPDTFHFRQRSQIYLERIADQLSLWLADWTENEIPGDFLQEREFPFDMALEEQVSRVWRAIELLERDTCPYCNRLVLDNMGSDHDYSCTNYLPKHRQRVSLDEEESKFAWVARHIKRDYEPRHRGEPREHALTLVTKARHRQEPHVLHYTSDDGTPDGTWSVYRELYVSPDADEPIDGTQEWVSRHASESEADTEARRLQDP